MNTPAAPWAVHLRLIVMAALWGASWPWARVVAQTMPPLTATTLRCAVAGAVLLLWLAWSQRGRGPGNRARQVGAAGLQTLSLRQWLALALAAATGILAYSVCFMYGLQRVPAGRASVVIALNPVLTLVLAAWLFGERLNLWVALGMALAVTGALTAITHGQPLAILRGELGWGEWLLLGCVLSWVAYTLIGRGLLAGVNPFVATTAVTLLGGTMLGALSLVVEGPAAWFAATQAPVTSWLCLLGMGVLSTALAYAWYFQGIHALGAGTAAAYISLVPMFGMGLATLWLREPMHASLAVGGAIAVLGMGVMHWGRTRAGR